MNEHISRLQAIGIGEESVSGTPVAATAWIPKKSGSLTPSFEKALDDSAYGVIDEVADSETVKNMSNLNLEGILRDDWIGILFKGALGTYSSVQCVVLSGVSGGTPARGDIVYVGAPSSETFIGEIKKILLVGATTYYFISTTSGALVDSDTLTDGTWTATAGVDAYAAVKGHFFSRLNTNHHPSFTLYGHDPVGDERSAYCMVNTLDIEFNVGDFGMFTLNMMGKKLENTTAQTPAYGDENPFLTKHATLKFADDESGLNAASGVSLQRAKITINKNLTDVMAWGSDDVDTLHNQQFNVSGDMDILYKSTTYRDYVADSTKKACRMQAVNNSVTALYDDAANSLYPSIYIDMSSLSFEEWTRSEDLNSLVNQTLGFACEYSRTLGMTIEALVLNDYATGY